MNVCVSLLTYSKPKKSYVDVKKGDEDMLEKGGICELNKRDQLQDYQHIGGVPYFEAETTQKNIIEGDEESDIPEPAVDCINAI